MLTEESAKQKHQSHRVPTWYSYDDEVQAQLKVLRDLIADEYREHVQSEMSICNKLVSHEAERLGPGRMFVFHLPLYRPINQGIWTEDCHVNEGTTLITRTFKRNRCHHVVTYVTTEVMESVDSPTSTQERVSL